MTELDSDCTKIHIKYIKYSVHTINSITGIYLYPNHYYIRLIQLHTLHIQNTNDEGGLPEKIDPPYSDNNNSVYYPNNGQVGDGDYSVEAGRGVKAPPRTTSPNDWENDDVDDSPKHEKLEFNPQNAVISMIVETQMSAEKFVVKYKKMIIMVSSLCILYNLLFEHRLKSNNLLK